MRTCAHCQQEGNMQYIFSNNAMYIQKFRKYHAISWLLVARNADDEPEQCKVFDMRVTYVKPR
jgi:hypothetical protein